LRRDGWGCIDYGGIYLITGLISGSIAGPSEMEAGGFESFDVSVWENLVEADVNSCIAAEPD
jgi:hypothetical protein